MERLSFCPCIAFVPLSKIVGHAYVCLFLDSPSCSMGLCAYSHLIIDRVPLCVDYCFFIESLKPGWCQLSGFVLLSIVFADLDLLPLYINLEPFC